MDKNLTEVEQDEMSDVVELTDDTGRVLKFYHIATLPFEDGWFAFFQPAEEIEGVDPEEVVIFEISGEEGEEILSPITDDEKLDKVYAEFLKSMEDDEDEGEDEEGCHGSCSCCSGCGHDEGEDECECDCENGCDCDKN